MNPISRNLRNLLAVIIAVVLLLLGVQHPTGVMEGLIVWQLVMSALANPLSRLENEVDMKVKRSRLLLQQTRTTKLTSTANSYQEVKVLFNTLEDRTKIPEPQLA